MSSEFPSFLEMKARFPRPAWRVVQAASAAAAVALCVALLVAPDPALDVLWRGVVPTLPLVFLLAPGLWRAVCPLAAANQAPRLLGFSRAGVAPRLLERHGFVVAAALFLGLVAARKPLLDGSGVASAALLGGALTLAFAGGVALRGRSGWCSSICPLLPVQRVYGQTPFAVVRNAHCPTCVGCTTNCYDFNPRVAQVVDLRDEERGPVRKLFAGALPGVVVAFFTLPVDASWAESYARIGLGALAGVGAIMLADVLLRPPPALLTAVFGAVALNAFYWYALPEVFGAPGWITWPARVLLATVTAVWLVRTARTERRVGQERPEAGHARVDEGARAALEAGAEGLLEVTIADRRVAVPRGTTLLEVAESHGLPLQAGCRMGCCGADPVRVIDGADRLSPAGRDELATIDRLGLAPSTRMACCACVQGDVSVSLEAEPAGVTDDRPRIAADRSVERVVVVGNGIAGVTAADHLRRAHPDCAVDLIGRERHPLYNRMAISRLIYGRSGLDELHLLPSSWYADNRIETWLNTQVEAIDRDGGRVVLATGERVPYDRLILTAGSSAAVPPLEGFDLGGAYALRTADDAMAIREELQREHARTAVVVGGGLLGLEAAYALHRFGLGVTVVHRSDVILGNQLDRAGASYLRSYLEGMGIGFQLGTEVARLEGNGRVGQVLLANGEVLPCELLLVAIGIKPNLDIPRTAGLEVGRGVLVDDGMRTSDPVVFAAGDVAEHQGAVLGLWPVAVEQARVAAVNAVGGDESYEALPPVTMLKVTGVDLTSVGRIEAGEGDEAIALEDTLESRYRKLVLFDGRLVGAILLGYSAESAGLAAAVRESRDITPELERLRAGDWSVFVA
jgi:NADPH-dependent 2,4-dienoyl-CoA reductase/sulfur reductase-like enzyme/ferredoxin